MRTVSAILAAVALLACGCATQQTVEPVNLEVLPDFNVAYSGGLNTDASTEVPEYTQPDGQSDVAYMLEVRILRCESAKAEEVFGARAHTIGAWYVEASELTSQRLAGLNVISAPRVTVMEGQSGTITILNEIAYISGFELSGKADTRVADPIVGVINEGILLGIRAQTAEADRMDLALDLSVVDLVKPIATQQVTLGGAPVSIQTPVVYTQRMTGSGKVAESNVVVLTGMADRDGSVYVVLISGERIDLDEAGAEPEPEDK